MIQSERGSFTFLPFLRICTNKSENGWNATGGSRRKTYSRKVFARISTRKVTNERDISQPLSFGKHADEYLMEKFIYLDVTFRSFGALINRWKGEMSFELIKLPDEWLINFGHDAVPDRSMFKFRALPNFAGAIEPPWFIPEISTFRQLSIRKKIRFNAVLHVHANINPDVTDDMIVVNVMKVAQITWRGLEIIWQL